MNSSETVSNLKVFPTAFDAKLISKAVDGPLQQLIVTEPRFVIVVRLRRRRGPHFGVYTKTFAHSF